MEGPAAMDTHPQAGSHIWTTRQKTKTKRSSGKQLEGRGRSLRTLDVRGQRSRAASRNQKTTACYPQSAKKTSHCQNTTVYLVKPSLKGDGKNSDVYRQIETNKFTKRSSVKETPEKLRQKEEN